MRDSLGNLTAACLYSIATGDDMDVDGAQISERQFDLFRSAQMLVPVRQAVMRVEQRPFVLDLVVQLWKLVKIGKQRRDTGEQFLRERRVTEQFVRRKERSSEDFARSHSRLWRKPLQYRSKQQGGDLGVLAQ